jgi:hypothetical protein
MSAVIDGLAAIACSGAMYVGVPATTSLVSASVVRAPIA